MCRFCLTRRSFLLAPALLPWAQGVAAGLPDQPVEPRVRLADPPQDGLTVAVTLDACPGGFDERIATALVASGIPATIFVTDLWMRRNPGGLAFLLSHPDIFGIENHGERHIPPVLGDRRIFGLPVAGDLATVAHEVSAGAAAIVAAGAPKPYWYRAATGFYSPAALTAIRQSGVGIGGYSLNADMGASLPAARVASRIGAAGNGDIIIAHINQPHRASGAGVVVGLEALRRRGARFRRLDHLTEADVVEA